jgi:hypothetical protein
MTSKSLILFRVGCCREIGQGSQMLGKSRAWTLSTRFAHKVIHKICGQWQKRFPIIDLGAFPQMIPSFLAQLALAER